METSPRLAGRSVDTVRAPRADIQSLRAYAVAIVVLFHLWPEALPGGFAGVDVFFVISGYLITSHLVRSARDTGTIRLGDFWARRARRLLPAALVVVLASVGLSLLAAPEAYWRQWFIEAGASAAYVENWVLAATAVNYWASESLASPFQHYWSLSVEEQFYIVWPILILAAYLLTKKWPPALIAAMAMVGIVSFALAGISVLTSPASAYFFTHARAWEFAAGGLVALAPALVRQTQRRVVVILGWALLGITPFVVNSYSGFPSVAALIPVTGASLVIWGNLATWGRFRPIQTLGDISYSTYLWHWPLVTLLPFALGHPMGNKEKVVVVLTTVTLAWLTKKFVEDPVRRSRVTTRTTLWAVAGTLVLSIGIAAVGVGVVDSRTSAVAATAHDLTGTPCFGAPALINPVCEVLGLGEVLYPNRASALTDIGDIDECYSQAVDRPTVSCTFGSARDDALRVAVVGNSHAEMMVVAIKDYAEAANWTIDSFVGRGGVYRWGSAIPDSTIQDSLLNGKPYDVVLVSYDRSNQYILEADDPRAEVLSAAWTPVIARGTRVIAIADNPNIPQSNIDCVLRPRTIDEVELAGCAVPVDVAFQFHDALPQAVEMTPGATLIDFTRYFCSSASCPLVIGNVIVYHDTNHMTATFARTLGPLVIARVNDELDRG
jgi:peptidoglycan/LPS O-acetylase OafA/YrhL